MSESRNRGRMLRKTMTDAERLLWSKRRNRRFSGFEFRRQTPLGRFFADFVCFDRRLILELDGGQHAEKQTQRYDVLRTAWLQKNGFRVIRFWNHELWQDGDAVEELIRRRLHEEAVGGE